MKRLAAVDNTLEELGTPKPYRKLHMCAKGLLIGWLICSHVGNMCDMIWWFYAKEDRRYLLIPFITNYYYHVNMFVDLLFVTILWFVYYLEVFSFIHLYIYVYSIIFIFIKIINAFNVHFLQKNNNYLFKQFFNIF